MTKYSITIFSKNKNLLLSFTKFLQRNLKFQKLQMPIEYIQKKQKTKKITVLKSPHVNKSAQEQFESSTYSVTINAYSYNFRTDLIAIKKIKNQLFPSLHVKIKKTFPNKNKQQQIRKQILTPKIFTFKLNTFNMTNQKSKFQDFRNFQQRFNKSNKKLLKKTISYLHIINCYGSLKI